MLKWYPNFLNKYVPVLVLSKYLNNENLLTLYTFLIMKEFE